MYARDIGSFSSLGPLQFLFDETDQLIPDLFYIGGSFFK
jgi:hypothetical protein